MGIRMLNHRPAVSQTAVGAAPAVPPPPVPALAAGASTARIPTDLAATLRHAATGLRRRVTPGDALPWRLWADLTRGYAALLAARIPRPVRARTVTVFVAAPPPAPDRPAGPPPREPHPGRADHADRPNRRDRRDRKHRPDGQPRPDANSRPDSTSRRSRQSRPERTRHDQRSHRDRNRDRDRQNRPGHRDR
ncbi:hypothetical protein ABZ858_02555 [Streptomyces sp. NPDC047017]|uniref:hypothetical protein n=1 Tax=Streptomyces sp. NPDC047017 TaxID=3155024 RepID=UPI003407D166